MITTPKILSAVAGDVIGSVYEWQNIKTKDFPLFQPQSCYTDDTVLTVAIADAILEGKGFAEALWEYGNRYPDSGYGGRFREWLRSSDKAPYGSFGNGSAMRVSPVGFGYHTLEETLDMARRTAEVTHNHPEGIKGAQAVAASIFFARTGRGKNYIRDFVSRTFQYDLGFSIEQIRPSYSFDVTCQGSVPQAIVSFLESTSYEDAVRIAVSLGGDSDTIACMAGGIAGAFYQEMPDNIVEATRQRLPEEFLEVIDRFDEVIAG